jgi:indoleamine 2,3-dioxygenase
MMTALTVLTPGSASLPNYPVRALRRARALDTFTGVNHHTPNSTATAQTHAPPLNVPFFTRMRAYMPRHHRNFLRHIGVAPRTLRVAVERMGDSAFTEAYNAAVDVLRRFRDAHLRIVALCIIGPSRRGAPTAAAAPRAEVAFAPEACAGQLCIGIGTGGAAAVPGLLHGTGGTDIIKFLKSVRDRMSETAFPVYCGAP